MTSDPHAATQRSRRFGGQPSLVFSSLPFALASTVPAFTSSMITHTVAVFSSLVSLIALIGFVSLVALIPLMPMADQRLR